MLRRRRHRGGTVGRGRQNGIGQGGGQRCKRLLDDRTVVGDVGRREIGPVGRQPSGHLRLVVLGGGFLPPFRHGQISRFERAERDGREHARQTGAEIPELPRGVERNPGRLRGPGRRHEGLEPGVTEMVRRLIDAEPGLREDRSGRGDIPRAHVRLQLIGADLDHPGDIPRRDPGGGIQAGQQGIRVPVVAGLRLQRRQRPLHGARVGLEDDRVGHVLDHPGRQVVEPRGQVGHAHGRLRAIGRDIDVDRPAAERRQAGPRGVGQGRVAVDEERGEPRLGRDGRRHGRQAVAADVERGEDGQDRQRAENGVGEPDVLDRERRQPAEARERRE